jgi:hypothetical protein
MIIAATLSTTAALANDRDCQDAADNYNMIINGALKTAALDYMRCLQSSRGRDNCSSQWSDFESAHQRYERAVRRYKSDCD